jgi:hypothetical protein
MTGADGESLAPICAAEAVGWRHRRGNRMSLFEFVFGLQAIILGLALTHLVTAANRLVLARERVRWAAQPLLAAGMVLVSLLLFWTGAWARRDVTDTTLGEMILLVLLNLALFASAAAVLPEEAPKDEVTDLGAHFEKVRVYFFALYALPIIVSGVVRPLVLMATGRLDRFENWENLVVVGVCALCMAVRRPWVNIAAMGLLLVWMVGNISGYELVASAG